MTFMDHNSLNNDKVKKNMNIDLVTIFEQFEKFTKSFIQERSKVCITGSILKIFFVYVISPHITINLH